MFRTLKVTFSHNASCIARFVSATDLSFTRIAMFWFKSTEIFLSPTDRTKTSKFKRIFVPDEPFYRRGELLFNLRQFTPLKSQPLNKLFNLWFFNLIFRSLNDFLGVFPKYGRNWRPSVLVPNLTIQGFSLRC